jgi:hypothetical protein
VGMASRRALGFCLKKDIISPQSYYCCYYLISTFLEFPFPISPRPSYVWCLSMNSLTLEASMRDFLSSFPRLNKLNPYSYSSAYINLSRIFIGKS